VVYFAVMRGRLRAASLFDVDARNRRPYIARMIKIATITVARRRRAIAVWAVVRA
jgi:hypothetical protein